MIKYNIKTKTLKPLRLIKLSILKVIITLFIVLYNTNSVLADKVNLEQLDYILPNQSPVDFGNKNLFDEFLKNPVVALRLDPWKIVHLAGDYPPNHIFYNKELEGQYELQRRQIYYSFASNLSSYTTGVLDKEHNSSLYYVPGTNDYAYIGPWVYVPKIGEYVRYALGSFEIKNNNNIKIKQHEIKIITPKDERISLYRFESIKKDLFFSKIGYNCIYTFKPKKNQKNIKCYNELDLSDYKRYIFYGTSSEEEVNAYMKFYNVYLLSSYYISEKDAKENKESWILPENKKEKRKILIMVPKDQVKYFIQVIKKLPDNALDNLIGYVWFMSEDIPNNKTGYKINYKRYDTKPNDKYDAELSRISGGKLKAKYGRYLTKERYSEDYVAPSIYGNNYNDKPDW